MLFMESLDSPEKSFKSGIVALMLHHELTLGEELIENQEGSTLAPFQDLGLDLRQDFDAVVQINKAVLPLAFDGLVLSEDLGPLLAEHLH